MQKWFYYIIKLFFPLLQRFTSLFRIFHISCGLFLAEFSLFYYQIVLSSATKIYLYGAFILLLIRIISCIGCSILLSNCYFPCYKDFLIYSIYLLLMSSIFSRTDYILLSNCSFLYNKVLLLYFIYFFSHEVFFL